jgi:hypothetical protein
MGFRPQDHTRTKRAKQQTQTRRKQRAMKTERTIVPNGENSWILEARVPR